MPMLRLACIAAVAVVALADPLLWSEHQESAIYDAVGISSRGYVAASTWFAEPEVAEVFTLSKGNKTTKTVGDTDADDNSYFGSALSEDGTTALAYRMARGNFTSTLYKWDVATPTPDPDWTLVLNKTVVFAVDVSNDGSTIAVAGLANVSYLHAATMQVTLYDGETGTLLVDGTYEGVEDEVLATPAVVALSNNGTFCAFASSLNQEHFYITVLHRDGGAHRHPLQSWKGPELTPESSIGISGDGVYVAAAQSSVVVVLKLKSASPPVYEQLFSKVYSSFPFFSGTNVISFAASSPVFALGWVNIVERTGKPRITAWRLPAQDPVLNYTWPVNPDQGQDILSSLAVSESGRYVAAAFWGSEHPAKSTEQVQVLSIPKASEDAEGKIVFKYRTPGSMMSIGATETVKGLVVVAAGRSTQFNLGLPGGDLFCLQATDSSDALAHTQALVDEVNSAATTWKAALYEQFAGHSAADLEALMSTKLKYTEPMPKANHSTTASRVSVPASFDARTQWPGCVGKIRDQGKCGAGWAFGAAGVLGDRACIATNGATNVTLSPEYVIDCDKTNGGCAGAYLNRAWAFLAQTGVVTDKCVPYEAKAEAKCNTKCKTAGEAFTLYKANGSSIVDLMTEQAMQVDIMKYGPIEAAVSSFQDLLTYSSGVYTHTKGRYLGAHSVKIIGWGTEGTTPYWLAANSWGTTWGVDGYLKIRRGVDECYIESNSVSARFMP